MYTRDIRFVDGWHVLTIRENGRPLRTIRCGDEDHADKLGRALLRRMRGGTSSLKRDLKKNVPQVLP